MCNFFGFESVKGSGVNVVPHFSTYIFFFKKSGKTCLATIFNSPSLLFQKVKVGGVGGNIVAHRSTYRIFLRKSGKHRVPTMFDSPSHPYEHVKFALSESGIQDAITYKTDGSDGGW